MTTARAAGVATERLRGKEHGLHSAARVIVDRIRILTGNRHFPATLPLS
jgi:hypothetical protein